jgi:putative flippase GtrA
LRRLAVEAFGYGLVSVVAFAVDTAALYTLVHQGRWHYLPASVLGFMCGATVAYLLSVRFVFGFHQLRSRPQEFASFVGLGLVGLVMNAAVLSAAISGVGLGLVTAKVIAAGCTFATNFTLRRQLLFAPPKADESRRVAIDS